MGINDWLDILPKWLGFALEFPVNPFGALGPYAETSIVSRDLVLLAAAGIAVSYLLIVITAPPSLAADGSPLVQFFRKIDPKLLPPILILVLIVFSVGLHLLARFYLAFPSANDSSAKWGAVQDTVNATLGFGSVFIPFATLLFSLMMRLFPISTKKQYTLFLVGTSLIAASFLIYLPVSLATVHATSLYQAFGAFCGAGVIAYAIFHFTYKWTRDA